MNIKKFFGHLNTVNKHRFLVFKLSIKAGIPIRGFLHDLSKYSPVEFFEGVKYYDGSVSPIKICKCENGYSKAWLHHKGRNKHHSEYWIDKNTPQKFIIMPYKYVAEMLCDKMAAGMIYKGKEWTKEYELRYWLEEKDKIDINPKIRDLVTDCLTQVSKNGIDEVYTKENFKKLYKKYCS